MGENSKIEWTHHTFNPWRGCVKVSAGCTHCYAEKQALRNPAVLGIWGADGTRVVASESMWKEPLRWNREAAEAGERRRVFCASMADVFEDRPDLHAPRARLFRLIDATPHLDWLLLTKRPENMRIRAIEAARLAFDGGPTWKDAWPANVWAGTSVENQEAADRRIPHLLEVPAAVRFLSCEPLLGAVDILPYVAAHDPGDESYYALPPSARPLHWVIVGGESGPGARPMHPDWARGLRDQCQTAHVPHFFKQWGEWIPYEHDPQPPLMISQHGDSIDAHGLPADLTDHEPILPWWLPDLQGPVYRRVGKHAAGRLLDGRTWDEFPAALLPAGSEAERTSTE